MSIPAIHVGIKQLGLDDETARDIYERETGKRSLRAMSDAEHKLVLAAFRKEGFMNASSRSQKGLKGPYAKKLQALWIAGWNLGLVRNRDDKALLAFVKRQTGLEHTQFLHDAANATKVIEALKGWLAREGGVDWTMNASHGFQIATAQSVLLRNLTGSVDGCLSLEHWLRREGLGQSPSNRLWIEIMNALGQQVRAKKAAG